MKFCFKKNSQKVFPTVLFVKLDFQLELAFVIQSFFNLLLLAILGLNPVEELASAPLVHDL